MQCKSCNAIWTVSENNKKIEICPFCQKPLHNTEEAIDLKDMPIQNVVKYIVDQYSPSIYKEGGRLKGLLQDLFPHRDEIKRKEKLNILIKLIDAKVAEKLVDNIHLEDEKFSMKVKELILLVHGETYIERTFLEKGFVILCYGLGKEIDLTEQITSNIEVEQNSIDVKEQVRLGNCYAEGRGVEQDWKKAVECYEKAALQGNKEAQCKLGCCYADGSGVEQNVKEAVRWFGKAAKQGFAEAQFWIGNCYLEGVEVEQDFRKAVGWLERAANQEYAVATMMLAVCYLEGQGVVRNEERVANLLEKAVEQGIFTAKDYRGRSYLSEVDGSEKEFKEMLAQYKQLTHQESVEELLKLGDSYAEGRGVERNDKEAFKCYEKVAYQGNAEAQCKLGNCYFGGCGVKKDYKEGMRWCKKAAEQGIGVAQWRLGVGYNTGEGVKRDMKEAVKWYEKAAEQETVGMEEYIYIIGDCYYEGNGVKKDLKKAVSWYDIGVKRGEIKSKPRLGGCYLIGEGVGQNRKKGKRLIEEAASQGDIDAQEISEIIHNNKI